MCSATCSEALNGSGGSLIANGSVYLADNFEMTKTMTLDTTYNADQCYILTYVYDKKQDGKILQTAMQKVK